MKLFIVAVFFIVFVIVFVLYKCGKHKTAQKEIDHKIIKRYNYPKK